MAFAKRSLPVNLSPTASITAFNSRAPQSPLTASGILYLSSFASATPTSPDSYLCVGLVVQNGVESTHLGVIREMVAFSTMTGNNWF